MINTFINSTTFGQTMAATFDLAAEGTLSNKRLTALEDCSVLDPIYEKEITVEKVADYFAKGKADKVSNLGKAVESENIRVNSLAMLYRELTFISALDTEEVVTIYVPYALLQELQSGRVRYYLSENTNSYFSELEINLWKEVLPLMQDLFFRIVFKNIETCKNNTSGDAMQALRKGIYDSMYMYLLKSYKEMKAKKSNKEQLASYGDAF